MKMFQFEKEAKEAEKVATPEDKEESGEGALRKIIAAHQEERGSLMDGFFDHLAAKYGGATKKRKPVTRSGSNKRKRN